MAGSKRELPLVRRRIEALLLNAVENGCTEGEASAAVAKAQALVAEYGIDRSAFRWPPGFSESSAAAASDTEAPKRSQSSGSGRGRGIGRLAERLIVEHPDWTYAVLAEEVNRQVEGAKASEKSLRWYASRMRRRGESVPTKRRPVSAP